MQPLNSRAVSVTLESYVRDRFAESVFFPDLAAGGIPPRHVRDVFDHYYLWQSRFPRWLGGCVATSMAFGSELNAQRVLCQLRMCLTRETTGGKHLLAVTFLATLGIDDPTRIAALPAAEALAGLAGRQLTVPVRNSIIISALSEHYGITAGLDFFRAPADLEAMPFRPIWEAIADDSREAAGELIEAARLEIWEHITCWDDFYSAVLTASWRPVLDPAVAANN